MNSLKYRPAVLIILDGWGVAPPSFGNAITSSHLPYFNQLLANFPNTTLLASGTAVGLPKNEPGNTQTAHLNLGAGRVVYQDLPRINLSIADGTFFKNPAFIGAINHAKAHNSKLHLMGLVGATGVHANPEHLYALLKLAKDEDFPRVFVHFFTDGRDTAPYEGMTRLLELENYLQKINIGKIATISGRFYAMDRDKRWERTEKTYSALINGVGEKASIPTVALEAYYRNGITDEFIPPTVIIGSDNKPVGLIEKDDAIIFFNHRGERAAQLTQKILQNTLNLFFVTLTQYDDLPVSAIAFLPTKLKNTIGEVFSRVGLKQLRLAESEKARFITYYFSGNVEEKFPGEERIIIPSPTVKTYDLEPQMAAFGITKTLLEKLSLNTFDFLVVNFANADMVGHTGLFKPTVIACEAIDNCLGQIVNNILKTNAILFITGDHGNAEEKIDIKSGLTLNEHTKNPVPLILVGNGVKNLKLKHNGMLADIAPTILKLVGLEIPQEMTGNILTGK